MNLSRSDTYINVYLPRQDGEDPRRYAQPNSPLFENDSVYKFSDQIVKDRRLFLGRKQMSLYEIYYKDGKDDDTVSNSMDMTREVKEDDEDGGKNEADNDENHQPLELPSVKKVSLSLDGKSRRVKRSNDEKRFNEPLNAYIANRKKIQTLNRFNPNANIDRQVTTYDLMPKKREKTFYESSSKIKSLHRLIQKSQSAPVDTRKVRSLGLPPIVLNNRHSQTTILPVVTSTEQFQPQTQTIGRAMPVRPSSKPNKIWKHTNFMLSERFASTPKLLSANMKYLDNHMPRLYVPENNSYS